MHIAMSASRISRLTSDDLWTQAATSLSKEDQANLDFQRSDKLEILSDLLSLTEKEIQRCEKGRISFRRKSGEKVFARDLFAKIVRWIEHFKQVGDVAVQYDPVHASLPWAGIRFLLEVTVSDFNAAELILEHTTSLAEMIPRYTIFEQIFLQSTSGATSELERCLTALYAKMLLYLAKAKAHFQHGTLKRSVKNVLLVTPDFENYFHDIFSAQITVDRCAAIVGLEKQLEQHLELKTILNDMDTPLRRIDRTIEQIQDTLEASKRTSILQWLSAEPYQKHHKQARSDFLSGTGAWLLADPVYRKWKDESASSILWLHGIPGSGKSKLVSAVIEDTLQSSQTGQSPLPVYFYCSRNPAEPTRSIPSEVIASIARQLARTSPTGPLLPPAIAMYEEQEVQGFAAERLTLDESQSLIIDLLALHPVATIIIDALDECDPDTRADILDVFTNVLHNSSTLVKLFVSSRDDQDIVYQLKDYPNLELSSDKNSADIVHFVRSEADRLIARKMLLRSSSNRTEMRKAIVAKVSEDANGMFRWASLQLQALCQLKTDKAIRERIGKNPPQLEELYQEIMSRIEHYPANSDRQYAMSAFRWLLYVRRRLDQAEFLAAVSTQVGSSTTLLSLEQVLDLCCNLVIFDITLNTFRFAHLSVREFLQNQASLRANASHGIAAEVCLLSIIMRSDGDETRNFLSRWNYPEPDRDVLSTLYDYADAFWAVHCQNAGCMRLSGNLQALLSYFMAYDDSGSPPFRIWHAVLRRTLAQLGSFNRLHYRLRCCRSAPISPVFTACCFDLAELLPSREMNHVLNQGLRARCGNTCLELAVRFDAQRCLDQLLPTQWDSTSHSVLSFAIQEGTSKSLERLLGQKEQEARITENSLMAAATNNQDGANIMALLVSAFSPRLKISAAFLRDITSLIQSETVDGQRAVLLLRPLQSCDPERFRASISSSVLELATKGYAPELLEFFLDLGVDHSHVTSSVMKSAVSNPHHAFRMAERLLASHRDYIVVSEDIMVAACHNLSPGRELIKLLMERSRYPVSVTESVVISACKNEIHGTDLVELLINKAGDSLSPTGAMVIAACGNMSQGLDLVLMLMTQFKEPVPVTEDIIIAACHAQVRHQQILQYLFDHHVQGQFQLTERLIGGVLAKPLNIDTTIPFLFDQCDTSLYVTGNAPVKATWPGFETAEKLIECAARGSTWNGVTVMKKLLARQEVAITHAALLAATSNSDCGFDITSLFCDRLGSNLNVTGDLLMAAVSQGSHQLFRLLLDKATGEYSVSERLLLIAATNWHASPEMLVVLLRPGIEITEDVLIAVGRIWEPGQLITFLTKYPTAKLQVTKYFIMAAARHNRKSTLLAFLDHESILSAHFEESCLIAAAGNRHMSTATNYMLNGTLGNFVVTPAVIKAACTNDVNGLDYLDYLLKKSENKIPLNEDILCAAAANEAQGFDLLLLLLQYQPESFHITEDLLNTAARNEERGTKILDLLSERCVDRSTITDKLLQTAMLFRPHDIPTLALSDGDPHGRISEETLVFAARYSNPNILSKLLKPSNQQITGAVLEAAARNVNGIAMLTWFLDRPFDPAVITPVLVAAATQNARHGEDLIGYLQSKYPDQTRAAVTEQVVLAAASSRQISLLDMLEKRYSISVTEEHRSIARLRHASLTNDLRTVQDLLATGVHPDYPDGAGRTPLRLASKKGYLKTVQALIGTGQVDVNAQDDLGQTPLLVAVLHEHHDLIYPLMEAGADPDLKDSCSDTPYSVAEKAGDYISLRRLREGAKLRAVREIQK